MKNLLFAGLLILCGCATGSHVITGKVRPAITPDAVKIMTEAPAGFESIGMVSASANGNGQRGADRAIAELKRQAGLIGANVILVGAPQSQTTPVYIPTQYGGILSQQDSTSVSGTAGFAP